MGHEEVERISRELEELLDMQEESNSRPKVPGARELLNAQREYSRLLKEETEDFPGQSGEASAQGQEEEENQYSEEVQECDSEEYDREEYNPEEENFESHWTFVRPADGLTAAFVVPVLAMLIIFLQRRIFPFGEESFLRTDMYHQYAPFFSEFQYKLTHGGSLFYSWNVGMG